MGGRHITSGSSDKTIRIWDAVTGSAIGKALKGHTDYVQSVAYSSDGLHIISAAYDKTIRIWNARTSSAFGEPLEGNTDYVRSVACSLDGQQTIPGSSDIATHESASLPHIPIQSTPSTIWDGLPDSEGWVRDSVGGLRYWVPQDCRAGLHSPALLTIPITSRVWSVSLQFEQFAFGTSWTAISNPAHP